MPKHLFLTLILFFAAVNSNSSENSSEEQVIPTENTYLTNNITSQLTDSVEESGLPSSLTVNLPAPADIDSLSSLFKVMAEANRSIDFHSLMTYEANGFITTYRLAHNINENVVEEQLLFMDGPRRQVVRRQKLNTCHNGETRWGLWPINSKKTLDTYTLRSLKAERIADREAVVFELLPKDSLRYAYQYSLDKETGLLLRAVTYHKSIIIERLQTVAIDFVDADSALDITAEPDYLWRVPEAEPCHTQQFEPAWKVSWLPDGFVSGGNRITTQGEQVLMFTDGIVSISVFIISNGEKQLKKATARHGATVVVISPESSSANKSIAVVGEIPIATARRIAVSVKPI